MLMYFINSRYKKYPFNFLLSTLLIFALSPTIMAQSSVSKLIDLYNNKNFKAIEEIVGSLQNEPATNYEILFFRTLFIPDGEKAEQQYQQVFEKASQQMKYFAAQKLMDYYYSVGYYVASTKYQKYLVEHSADNITVTPKQESAPAEKKQFFIQVGAFGLQENAEQQRKFLATQDILATVVERVVNDKILFCVWVDGKSDLDNTLAYANRIKQKYDLNYQIMSK